MRRISIVWIAVLSVLLVAPAALADLVSRYSVAGQNTDGTPYTGVIEFKPAGQVYRFDFTGGDDSKMNGLAIEYENFLALAAVAGEGSGDLVIYQRRGNGWVGVFSAYAEGKLGSEVLYNGRRPDLADANRPKPGRPAGQYVISGTNPDGSTYSGEGEITAWTASFDVRRTIGNEQTTGTAVAFKGALAMNVGKGDAPRAKIGLLGLLIPEANGFRGVWGRPGSQQMGAERWVRK